MRCARTLVLQGSVSIVALLASAFVGGASATGPGVAPRIACASLTGLTLPQTQILSATQKANYCNVIGVITAKLDALAPAWTAATVPGTAASALRRAKKWDFDTPRNFAVDPTGMSSTT